MDQHIRATEMLFDETELARRARTTLAGAETGRLILASARGRRYEWPVAVTDDGGEPVLSSGRLGLLGADPRAHAALRLAPNDQFGVGLTLIGRISMRPGPRKVGRTEIGLSVERVLISCPHRTSEEPRREISLASYATAEPDSIAAHAGRIARHLTEDHQPELRGLLARCTRQPVGAVVAAQVSRISATVVQFWWVNDDGAQPFSIHLEPPAVDLTDLGHRLRELMARVQHDPS